MAPSKDSGGEYATILSAYLTLFESELTKIVADKSPSTGNP